MLNILADKNIYKLSSFLPNDITVNYFDPTQAIPSLNGIDALLVRTVSTLNADSVPTIPSSLKCIGTGSSGSDHIDFKYFKENGISVFDAKGCNANAVAEYVLTSLLLWSIERKINLQQQKIGIIGAGATGSAVQHLLTKLNIPFCSFDPPKQEVDSSFASASLSELLACDILTFHVPLTKNGDHPTFHWLDDNLLADSNFNLIINAARGGVINELHLMKALEANAVGDIILDVWEGEPDFNPTIMEKAFIATPHIAGYSEQAKLNASYFLAKKLSAFFGFTLPDSNHLFTLKTIDTAHLNYSLKELLLKLHPIKEYDSALRDLVLRPDKKTLFAKLRVDRPYRYEYPFLKVSTLQQNQYETLSKIGVHFID